MQSLTETPALRKIAILGTATTSVNDAPYTDPTWKIWSMSNNFWLNKRFDLWFEFHEYETLKACGASPKYFEFLQKNSKALVTGHACDLWPDAIPFPLEAIVLRFGDYFTCSFAYMLAYALHLHEIDVAQGGGGIGTIGLWGVDMAVGEEYSHQKPCAEYWIGMARGMGIEVIIAPESPICRTNAMYAFDNPKLAREFTDRLADLANTIKTSEDQLRQLRDAAEKKGVEVLELRAAERVLKDICHRWAL